MEKKVGKCQTADGGTLITRKRAEEAVPLTDCSGREYSIDEREDIIRYVLLGIEIQRDMDLDKLAK